MSDDDDLDALHSPRKRRRLGSFAHTQRHAHQHKQRRRRHEDNYRDEYRVLFNEHVTQTASLTTMQHSASQLGSSPWSPADKTALFAALDRLGRHDLPGIAAAIATKTQPEVRAFLAVLHDAAAQHTHVESTLAHLPAALDIAGACAEQLDDAADALAWYQETLEAAHEQKRHGDYWLITPDVAADIQDSIAKKDDDDAARQTPAAHGPLNKRGRGIAGACLFCKERKKKCDRNAPCAYCQKSGVQCVYTAQAQAPAPAPHTEVDQKTVSLAVPEAALLRPDMMLKLSREVFMNRSADFPSPWLHWSQYTSELATEPSMYRTAFNDFHRLVVSITRRLVQTTITQATSRLRAQRHRNTKRAAPLIKLRDAYTAVDVIGLARSGHERWRGAPRRCGLKVYTHKYTPKNGRERRHLSWTDVEQALSPNLTSDHVHASQSDASIEPDDYKSRMARSGTPLPIHNLTLSDPEIDTEHTDISEDDNSVLSEQFADDDLQLSASRARQSRDLGSRSSSVVSDSPIQDPSPYLETVRDLDHTASKKENEKLYRLLGSQAPASSPPSIDDEQDIPDINRDAKIITAPNDWELYFDYQAPWEKYTTPVSEAKLLANRDPVGSIPRFPDTLIQSPESDLGNVSNMSSDERSASRRQKGGAPETELHVRGTNAYAAWRRDDFAGSDQDMQSSPSDSEAGQVEDTITQSIEAGDDSADSHRNAKEEVPRV